MGSMHDEETSLFLLISSKLKLAVWGSAGKQYMRFPVSAWESYDLQVLPAKWRRCVPRQSLGKEN